MATGSRPPRDPILALAVNVEANPGVYALLIGSGVSRPAGIPTGWEVVVDLCRKLAGRTAPNDPAAWYRAQYGEPPQYDRLLDQLTATPAERQALLKEYFEPTPDERERQLKIPTAAHRAIAAMARTGHVRMILTTNFDRLIEVALADEGVVPQVIASEDAIKGATPYAHAPVTVVKVHGDYLDTRIRNTTGELAKYERAIDEYLDRIFDDFGLIIAGWSASDPALVDAIQRAPNRRYGSYWLSRGGDLSPTAKRLTDNRRAIVIVAAGADEFFSRLAEDVVGLGEMRVVDPVAPGVVVALLERYLPDPLQYVRLDHLVLEEVERLHQAWSDIRPNWGETVTAEAVGRREAAYRALAERPARLVASLGRYTREPAHARYAEQLVVAAASAAFARPGNFIEAWLDFAAYPALLALYAGGIVAIDRLLGRRAEHAQGGESDVLARLLGGKVTARWQDTPVSILTILNNHAVFAKLGDFLPNARPRQKWYFPGSNLLRSRVGEFVITYMSGEQYEVRFDQLEYLIGLVHLNAHKTWGALGEFVIFQQGRPSVARAISEVRTALTGTAGEALTRAGLFVSSEDLAAAIEAYDTQMREEARRGYF